MTRIGPRFRRVEPRRRSRAFVPGLLAALPRKNCWTIAEHAGDTSPDGMQHLLARARWDADGVRDDLRSFVIEHLGDPDAVLVADETGDLKKGTATAGVQRQYTGTAGRIENAQVAVYLGYASPGGHALIDRELYLPRSWTGDPDRCRAAGIPKGTQFATKPQLARRMIERAIAAGVPFGWFAADEAYGDNGKLRTWLEECQVRHVLAVSRDHRVRAGAGRTLRADALAARLPKRAWQRLSAGPGARRSSSASTVSSILPGGMNGKRTVMWAGTPSAPASGRGPHSRAPCGLAASRHDRQRQKRAASRERGSWDLVVTGVLALAEAASGSRRRLPGLRPRTWSDRTHRRRSGPVRSR